MPLPVRNALQYFGKELEPYFSEQKSPSNEKVAFINDTAYEIRDGETILSFIRRHLGSATFLPLRCP